jgi:hypothetical protein
MGTRTVDTGAGWRSMVSRSRLLTAFVAGFVATHIATVTGYWYHGIFLEDLDWPAFNGFLIVPNESTLAQFWTGTVYHYATGISFGLIFAFLIHPLFRGGNSTAGNIGKAVVFSLVLALLSAAWWVPALFPEFSPGVFSTNLGTKVVIGIFVWHLIYGINLGALYNPLPEERVGGVAG